MEDTVAGVAPLVLPISSDARNYSGYVTACGRQWKLGIHLPINGNHRQAQLYCEPDLKHLLRGAEAVVRRQLQQAPSIAAFLEGVPALIQRLASQTITTDTGARTVAAAEGHAAAAAAAIVKQLDILGWDAVNEIDENLSTVTLQHTDVAGRVHLLRVTVPPTYPLKALASVADLPLPLYGGGGNNAAAEVKALPVQQSMHQNQQQQYQQQQTLMGLHAQFKRAVERYQTLWDLLDELHSRAWVLDPAHNARGSARRRIALGEGLSLELELNAEDPLGCLPALRLLGPDAIAQPLRRAIATGASRWPQGKGLVAPLEALLGGGGGGEEGLGRGFVLPSPPDESTAVQELNVECGICYVYNLDGDLPEEVCQDKRCRRPFHRSCLVEWLRALPETRQSFDTLFGSCPYCEQPITVKSRS
eukprot:UC1_evm3s707